MRRRRAMTLLELIVTMVVTAMLGTVLVNLIIFQSRITMRVTSKAQADQIYRVLYETIRRDCQQSGVPGVTLGTDNQSLATQPIDSVTVDAQTSYKTNELISYHYTSAAKTLTRKDWLPPPFALTALPVRLTGGQWLQLGSAAPAQSRKFLGVEDFRVESDEAPPNMAALLRFQLKMETVLGPWTGQFVVLLRNPA